jgi:putative FmdB family regulatory protein
MAVYIYRCKSCKTTFPVRHSMADLDKVKPECPMCEAPTDERVLQPVPQVGERVKGTGGAGTKGFK